MLKQAKIQPSHEDLFIERYDRLMSQALHLAEGDRQQAEDLLHDAFVQFTLLRPNLETISNPEGYLYITLRNLRLSQVRRASRRSQLSSLASYDSIAFGLRASNLRTEIQVQDELRSICEYACIRKETSKGGSVLLLRFFHGYYPSETAQVLRTGRNNVDNWLALARREAKLFQENPNGLVFMGTRSPASTPSNNPDGIGLLDELRARIFQSRQGDCFSVEQLADFYSNENKSAIDGPTVAHLVSCATCLDEVNRMLHLPLLSERNPFDLNARDPRPKGGDGPGGGTGTGPTTSRSFVRRGRGETRATFEHRPQELQFSANGFLVGTLKIDSERSEQTININLDERISFIEAFSEQGVRLLLMNVEPPPEGAVSQSLQIGLSDQRSLQLSLTFGDHWPTLHSVYFDPMLSSASATLDDVVDERASDLPSVTEPRVQTPQAGTLKTRLLKALRFVLDRGFLIRPATVTAAISIALIATLLLLTMRKPTRPLVAADLLSQSAATEQATAARADQVLHRTINFEEKRSDGVLISRRRIDVWQSAVKGVTARRLYDEQNKVVAGDWRTRDGVETLYHHASRPQIQLVPEKRDRLLLTFENVWQLSLSAAEFQSLVENSIKLRVEERSNAHVISYESDVSAATNGLVRTTITLAGDDLHATEQTVVIRQGEEAREFRLVETAFERRAPDAVPPAMFEPDPELLTTDTGTRRTDYKEKPTESPSLTVSPPPAAASADLEVEVLRLLHESKADLGEPISVTKAVNGVLQVSGLVDTAERKAEIMRQLHAVANNPAVRIEIQTVAEAVAQQQQQRSRSKATPAPVVEQDVQINHESTAQELRRHFSSDEQMREFSLRILNQSRSAMSHVGAIRRLVRQFSPEELHSLTPPAKQKWLSLIHSHALAYQSEAQIMRNELRPIFFPGASESASDGGADIRDDAGLIRAGDRLFDLSSANDEMIRSALGASSSGSTAITSPQFWQSMNSAAALAGKIARGQ